MAKAKGSKLSAMEGIVVVLAGCLVGCDGSLLVYGTGWWSGGLGVFVFVGCEMGEEEHCGGWRGVM